ncbi:MAG: sigma-70 family RNA polymerase sigma factor [bacterium]|nr:sigma-70 family RNA polymerase sigma factor [bacterium]
MAELSWLVEQSRRGDLESFGQLVRRFQDMAHGYAYSVLGDFHLAEDVAQEAFIDAYRKLDDLREPAAFPGWFRRIVFKHCDRATRGKRIATAPLEEAHHVPEPRAERSELEDRVLDSVRGLPERQREATTLFYINGYSQGEIADFLEVPVTTVQKRLHDARKKLKQRMIDMVEDTLKTNAPNKRFSQKVVDELMGRPDYLRVEGHPVREILDAVRAALPEFEYVEGEEALDDRFVRREVWDRSYRTADGKILRGDTTAAALKLASERTPPVRLLTAGRVFRTDPEDASHSKVFHQLEGLCIDAEVSVDSMKEAVSRAISAALPGCGIAWKPAKYPGFENEVNGIVEHDGQRVAVFGCGIMAEETLRICGHNPGETRGYSFGIGLERLAMLKHGVNDIHDFRRPPYMPGA